MKQRLYTLISLVIFALTVFYSFYTLVPHKISGKDTPESEFSTIRAMEHIKIIAKEPHFVGTQYHETVRTYLIGELEKLGMKAEVQSQFSVNEKWGGATMNHNIIATKKGTGNGKALMILSHYDSAPFASKGASDDAVGVATMIEGIRAFIKSDTKHINDIIIMFSDGEEIGLNGAKAFVEHHPLAKNVGLVINFEARGSGGPSFTLMETNGGNEQMVRAFAASKNALPIANSFLYSVYKMLPNDTDLTMFRELGNIEGFNFAFIDDFYDYHCSTDNYENVDINTVEHQGLYLMSLLNKFKDYDLSAIKSDKDLIYFNFPVIGMIYYPFEWAKVLFFILLVCSIFLISYLLFTKKILIKNLLSGFIPLFIILISGIIISIFGWRVIIYFHPWFNDILHGFPHQGHIYIAAFSFLSIGIFTWIYSRFFKKLNITELALPFLILWIIVIGFFTYKMTGASFLIIPVFSLLLVLLIENLTNLQDKFKITIYHLLSIPSLIIIVPFIDMFPVGLKMKALSVSIVLLILLLGAILPIISNWSNKKIIAYSAILISIILFFKAEMNSNYSVMQPKQNSLNYVYYADEKLAYWETFNGTIDPWLEKVMGNNLIRGSKADILLNSKYNSKVTYNSPAPEISLAMPSINVLSDSISGKYRSIEFEIVSNRKVNYIELLTARLVHFENFAVNGMEFNTKFLNFKKGKNSLISYYITEPNEKPRIKIKLDKEISPEFVLYESSYDLMTNTELKIPQRYKEFIPMPFVLNDQIIVIKKLRF